MLTNIFTAAGWDQVDTLVLTFYDCTFLKDFGPWKEGQEINVLNVDFESGKIEEFDPTGRVVINRCLIGLVVQS